MKKKLTNKALAAAVAASMALSMAACGNTNAVVEEAAELVAEVAENTVAVDAAPAEESAPAVESEEAEAPAEEAKSFNGLYTAIVELDNEWFVAQTGGMELQDGDVINMVITIDLKDDGNYTFKFDMASTYEDMKNKMTKAVPDFYASMFAEQGIDESMFETVAQASGYDSYDAMIEDATATMIAAMDESMASQDESQFTVEGTYTADETEVVLDGEKASALTIQADGSLTMTLPASDSPTGKEMALVFVK